MAIANSPFFALPPELRNLIYGAVFEPAETKALVIEFHYDPKARVSTASPLKLRIPGIELLLVCRDVYNEAVNYLYSMCRFVACTEKRKSFIWDHMRQAVFQVAEWLDLISEKRSLIRDLEVDLIPRFRDKDSTRNEFPRIPIPIGPLLRHVFGAHHRIAITFTARSRSGSADLVNLKGINQILNGQLTHPFLGTYLRCWRSLETVYLWTDGCIELKFRSPYRSDNHLTADAFDMSGDGQLVPRRWRQKIQFDGLLRIPLLLETILDSIIGVRQHFVFDVNLNMISPRIPCLLQLSRRIRTDLMAALCKTRLIVQTTVAGRRVGFKELELMRHFCENGDWGTSTPLPQYWERGWGNDGANRVRIVWKIPSKTPPEDARFAVNEFLNMVDFLSSKFRISFQTKNKQELVMGLAEMRVRYIQHLTALCKRFPEHRHSDVEEAWMDCDVRIVETCVKAKDGELVTFGPAQLPRTKLTAEVDHMEV